MSSAATEAGPVRKLDCPACGGALTIRAAGYTTTLACQYCGSVLDVTTPEASVIAQYHEAAASLAIPLGTRGTIDGTEWDVVGWQARDGGGESWEEFLLFNPYAGYRWLVLYEGDWTFGRTLADAPVMVGGDRAGWRGRRYVAEDPPSSVTTTRVVGEFYWRAKAGETVEATTFINGDDQLSFERSADEANWTWLSPLPAAQVYGAFGGGESGGGGDAPRPRPGSFGRKQFRPESAADAARLAAMSAPGEAEPRDMSVLGSMWGMATVAAILLLIVTGLLSMRGTPATGSLAVVVDGPEKTVTIGPIVVGRTSAPVSIDASADTFSNKWIDLDYTLVERTTKRSIEAGGTAEFYEGDDSDGHWTEGDRAPRTLIAQVPKGTYDLVIDASAHTWQQGAASLSAPVSNPWAMASADTITVAFSAAPGGMLWGNYITILVLLFVPPGIALWLRMRSDD